MCSSDKSAPGQFKFNKYEFHFSSHTWIKYSIILYVEYTYFQPFCFAEDGLNNNLKLTSDALKLKKQLLEGTF